MFRIGKTAVALLAALLAAFCARGELRVSVLTFHPGEEFFQLEGHTGLRIVDSDTNTDITYNWGTFDFTSPGFLWRFCKGRTDYLVEGQPTQLILPYYAMCGRRVTELELDISAQQARRLKAMVDSNMLPANRTYRYNYVLDNCATRPLLLVERAVADSVHLGSAPSQAPSTFRQMMRHYHANYPWYQFGIDLALGSGIDRPISNREKAFAPVELEEMLRTATYVDDHGHTRRLAHPLDVVYEGRPGGATLGPTPWYATPNFVCWAFFGLVVVASWRDFLRRRVSRWIDTVLFTVYGLAGIVIFFLTFFSEHEATYPNWLILWLNPLCLLGAVAIWVKSWKRLEMSWQILNFALIVALMLLGVCGVQQLNSAFWPLMLAGALRSLNYVNLTLDNDAANKLAQRLMHK